jgi:hypothetical protein
MFMASKAESHVSTDHEEIRRWAEARGGQPACVKGTGGEGDIGMLRLDFPGYGGEESLQHIGWDDWFQKFDERELALLFQEQTAGGAQSNFNKLISRETAEESRSRSRSKGRTTTHRKSTPKKRAPAKKAAAGRKTTRKSAAKKATAGPTAGRKKTRKSTR